MEKLQVQTCYATCSIGANTALPLPAKLQVLSTAGFDGIELSFPDLLQYARETISKDIAEDDYDSLSAAASAIKAKCDELGLKIFMLQPFANFEGWPAGSKERSDAFERAKGWSRIMLAAAINLLQIGSSDSPDISHTPQDHADDLGELADLFAKDNLAIAYENWCWASRAPTWEAVWEIVRLAGRPNLGLCLDTFQIAGSLWADPTTSNGLSEEAQDMEQDDIGELLHSNLRTLAHTVPKDKIFILQVSDAYKMEPPLESKGSVPAKSRWSHEFRPLPFGGGYLPVGKMAQAVFDTGFRGIVSVEVFDSKEGKKFRDDLGAIAKEGMKAIDELRRWCVG